LKADSITRSHVKKVKLGISSPSVANQVIAAVSAIFSWAMIEEKDGVKANPASRLKRNKLTKRKRILADSEIPKFWEQFGSAHYVRGMALKMILLTGQRPGEIRHMRTEHLIDGWWEMPGDPIPRLGWPGTKNKMAHRVWLPEAAQQILKEIDATGFVFAGARGKPIDGLEEVMADIYDDLGVERITPHDLRRTHGSTITGLGFGRDAMNRIQNHLEGGIADVYDQHQYADENKNIMEKVVAKFLRLIEGRPAAGNVLKFAVTTA